MSRDTLFHLCPVCVRARGLQRGDPPFVRVMASGLVARCDDCAIMGPVEAWRRVPADGYGVSWFPMVRVRA